jgi:hypothetical protein
MKETLGRALRPDAQAFDEIRIKTMPRYKESEMSGSEWRISAVVEFLRHGEVKASKHYSTIETAAGFLYGDMIRAAEDGAAFYGGEGDFCDQEGCTNKYTVKLKKKYDWCRSGHKSEQPSTQYRKFCERHSSRGDCGLDDADQNYERIP